MEVYNVLQMVMHVCSVAQEIAENYCEGNHQEQEGRAKENATNHFKVRAIKATR